MAVTGRVVLNRKALSEIELAIADGLFAVAEHVLEIVDVPDAAPYGEGLIQGGGAVAYAGTKKVNGTTIGGRQVQKPRGARTQRNEVAVFVGFGFPARLVERGTIDTDANPFLSRAVLATIPESDELIAEAARRHTDSVPG